MWRGIREVWQWCTIPAVYGLSHLVDSSGWLGCALEGGFVVVYDFSVWSNFFYGE